MHSTKKFAKTLLKWNNSSSFARKIVTATGGSHLPLDVLSEEELATKEAVARFAREQIAPMVQEMDENGRVDEDLFKQLFSQGLMGVEIPTSYCGSGLNFMSTIQVVEELSKVDSSLAPLVDVQNTLVVPAIMKLGTREQKAEYLPKLATRTCGSFALTEATAGSDAFALKTTAKPDGEHFVLNGTKQFISNADYAGVFVVVANARPEEGYKGITMFVVDRGTPGLAIGRNERKLGLRASGTCSLTFEGCRVHASQVLGQIGQGYRYVASLLSAARIGVAAQALGLMQGCFDATLPYTMERKQFGRRIYDFQAMQHQIARIATQIETARLLTYNAARLVEQKMDHVQQAAMAKYYAAEVAQSVTVHCIDWMGGVGFTQAFPQEKFYRDVKAASIYEGTCNVQLNTISKCIRQERAK